MRSVNKVFPLMTLSKGLIKRAEVYIVTTHCCQYLPKSYPAYIFLLRSILTLKILKCNNMTMNLNCFKHFVVSARKDRYHLKQN